MRDYKSYFIIEEVPEIVYKGLTNADIIRLWTGQDAVMEEVPGTEFELWDGAICGRNLEFDPGRKIVQQWYFGDSAPSIVTIILHPHKKGTSVELRHTHIPDEDYENMVEGWNDVYFAGLQDFYGPGE